MTYDPESVLQRYQQLLEVPEGEPEAGSVSHCALQRASVGPIEHATLGCDAGPCEGCCVGLVELVRQFSERETVLESRTLALTDTGTKAQKLAQD